MRKFMSGKAGRKSPSGHTAGGRGDFTTLEGRGWSPDRGHPIDLVAPRYRAINTTPMRAVVWWLVVCAHLGTVPVLALQYFSCTDCSVGGALSAQKQQCPPGETFCAAVSRPRTSPLVYQSSSVDRGCASSLHVACEQLNPPQSSLARKDIEEKAGKSATTPAVGDHGHRESDGQNFLPGNSSSRSSRSSDGGSQNDGHHLQPLMCCSTDICNGLEDARREGQRRSGEHLRTLMEGAPRKEVRSSRDSPADGGIVAAGGRGSGVGTAAAVEKRMVDGEDDNSARGGGVGGSRFATVLVIVGTFSQVLWLVGRLIE
ncbi:unnamed protein product [Ectocarpus sp. CCAP 1310/34]|nr:unnamed protein product [Ectocarpus sp. CCAP 1310/34]